MKKFFKDILTSGCKESSKRTIALGCFITAVLIALFSVIAVSFGLKTDTEYYKELVIIFLAGSSVFLGLTTMEKIKKG